MAQKFLPNASNRHQQDSKSGSSFSTMNDFTPHPETLGTSQGPSPQRTSKAPASKAKIPRLRARATRPLHKRSPSLKAFSITKKIRIGIEDTNNTGSSIKPPTTNTLEDLELEDAIELLKKKFQRSPFCSLSQLKADDLLNQLEQIAIDEKKYRPLQSDTTSSTQDSQSNSGLVDLEYASDDTSVLSSTPRVVATIDDFASEEVDHTESRQCKAHICDDNCKSKPLFHSTYPGCLFATHSAADWRRHEETTKHWPQQAFMCVYFPVPPMATDLNPKCQFCHTPFTATVGAPTAHYLRCPPAQIRGKTFRRKDKLLAHIRNDHLHIANPSQAAAAGEFQNSNPNWPRNCGFCELSEHVFISWNERMEHIAQHFQDGAKIADWRLPLPASKDCRPSGTSSHRLDDEDSDDDNGPHGGSGLSQRKFSGKKTAAAASSSSQRGQRSSGSRSNVPSSSGQRRRGNTPEELLDLAEQQMGDSLGARRKTSPALERYLNDPEEPIPALQSQLDQLPSADLSKDPQTPMIAKITMSGSEKQYMAELQDAIAKRARGVFQWADLVVQATRYHNDGLSPREIIQMLKEVPKELGDVYKHVLRKVTSKNYCRDSLRLMGLVCLSKRPLTVTEMCFAMSLPETEILGPKSSLAQPKLRPYDEMVRRIVSLSGGLIESKQHGKDQIVQFIHQSANDFFLRVGLRFFDKTSGDPIRHGHHQMSLICVNYMRIAEIDSFLAEFSVTERTSWAETRQTTREEDMAYSLLGIFNIYMPLIHGEGRANAGGRLQEAIDRKEKGIKYEYFSIPFSLSAVFDIEPFVAREAELREIHKALSGDGPRHIVISTQVNWSDKERECMQALRASDFHYEQFKDRNPERRKGTCQWVLQHENFRKWKENSSSKLLWISADPGCGKSVLLRSLVDKFFKDDNNAQKDIAYTFFVDSKGDGYGQTPLSWAAQNGHEGLVKLLLKANAGVDSKGDGYGQKPLSWAAQNGHEGIVKLLLKANADVDYSKGDYYRWTELEEAINSMFRWYRTSTKCYVYLPDVSRTAVNTDDLGWESAFRKCRWFTRGWTLQELIALISVEFFCRKSTRLGSKISLQQQIHEITGIPKSALQGAHLSQFSDKERFSWIHPARLRSKKIKRTRY
ncbi:hypothetical protein B0J14DRAFT_661457 [Halenospora varia]|nr:hypothetical protein B0J14DRAFT_661457 [Halenospora varia]